MADEQPGLLGRIGDFFSRGYDPAAAYGGLLTDPATKDAMMARSLAAMAGAFAEGAMPVPYRGGIPFAATLGKAGAAAYGGQDALIKARTEAAQQSLYGAQGDVQKQNLMLMRAYLQNRQDAAKEDAGGPGGPLSLLKGAGGTAAPGEAGSGGAAGVPADGQTYWTQEGLAALRPTEGKYDQIHYPSGDPSTASGAYGFLDRTWRQQAPLAGVDITKYPRAYRAPPELQDKVAAITPISHWTGVDKNGDPFNPAAQKLATNPAYVTRGASGADSGAPGPGAPGALPPSLLAQVPDIAGRITAPGGGLPAMAPAPPGPEAASGPAPSQLTDEELARAGASGHWPTGPAGPGPQGGLLAPQPGLGPPGPIPVSTGAGAPPEALPRPAGRLGGIVDALRGPPAGLLAGGAPPIVPVADTGGPPAGPAPNLVSGLPPPVSPGGALGGLLGSQPAAAAPGPPPPAAGAPGMPLPGPAPGLVTGPPPPVMAPPPPPPMPTAPAPTAGPAAAGVPTVAQIKRAKDDEALLTLMGKPVPPSVSKVAAFPVDVALAAAQAGATAGAQQRYVQGNAAYEAQVKANYQLWVERNKPQEIRPGGMIRDPITGQITQNPATIEVVDKAGNKYHYLKYDSPTPGMPPTIVPVAQSAIGPGAVQTLTQTAAAQPIGVINEVTQKGPGYSEPITTSAGSTIPAANTAAPIRGVKEQLTDLGKGYAKVEGEWGSSVAPSAKAIQRMEAIMTAMKTYQTGAWAEQKSEIIAGLRAVGISLPESVSNDPALAQEILKNNFGAALEAMKSTGLSRWTQAELFGQTKNLANPKLEPDANLAIGAQVIGTIQWEQQMLRDYRQYKKYDPVADPQDFQQRWTDANDVQGYIDRAAARIGPLKGGTAAPGAAPPAARNSVWNPRTRQIEAAPEPTR